MKNTSKKPRKLKQKKNWRMSGMGIAVKAHTKSEARAEFKRLLELPSSGRLPKYTIIIHSGKAA